MHSVVYVCFLSSAGKCSGTPLELGSKAAGCLLGLVWFCYVTIFFWNEAAVPGTIRSYCFRFNSKLEFSSLVEVWTGWGTGSSEVFPPSACLQIYLSPLVQIRPDGYKFSSKALTQDPVCGTLKCTVLFLTWKWLGIREVAELALWSWNYFHQLLASAASIKSTAPRLQLQN